MICELSRFKRGLYKSCGCVPRRSFTYSDGRVFKYHGYTGTRVYNAWQHMLRRCYSPKMQNYPYYGGRGITVCERWHSFENFLADMGEPPAGHSIDRIDNDGNYEPSNCRWASLKQQARNTRANRKITIDGIELSLSEWAEISGIKYHTIADRLSRGWEEVDAIFTESKSHYHPSHKNK